MPTRFDAWDINMTRRTLLQKGNARELIASIIRMSQKALACILIMVALGFVGGLLAIFFKPELADPLSQYAEIYIPLFQLEIGVYGAGSTVENVMKIRTQIGGVAPAEISGDKPQEENG